MSIMKIGKIVLCIGMLLFVACSLYAQSDPPSPKAEINVDLYNTSTHSINNIDFLVSGTGHVLRQWRVLGGFTTLTLESAGPNTIVKFDGGPVFPPDPSSTNRIHCGFGFREDSLTVLAIYLTWNDSIVACIPNLHRVFNVGHTGGVTFGNPVSEGCVPMDVYLSPVYLEYYNDNTQPVLTDMVANGLRNAMRIDTVNCCPLVIPAGGQICVGMPQPPAGATWVMVRYTASTNPSLTGGSTTFYLIKTPGIKVVPTLNEWGMIILGLILLATTVWLIRRRNLFGQPSI